MNDTTHTIPASEDAQAAVLGIAMADPVTTLEELRQTLTSEHFNPMGGSDSLLWDTIVEMAESRLPIDLLTVTEHARASQRIEFIGGPGRISEVFTAYASPEHIGHYVKILHEKYVLRKMREFGIRMTQRALEPGATAAVVLDEFHALLTGLLTGVAKKDAWKHIREGVIDALEVFDNAMSHRGRTTGLDTGFFDLNRMTDGLKPGQVIVVAGRPGMGKTAFGMNVAENIARTGAGVGIFSVEMTFTELAIRMVCSACGVDMQRVRDGFFSHADLANIHGQAMAMGNLPIWIDPSSPLTIADFRARARNLVARHGVKLLVIDYIQLMNGIGKRGMDNRALEVSEISVGIKQMAKELSVPVIVLAQLNRKVEDRRGNRPMLSDLKESGSIEQDADMVLLLYRPDYYKKDSEDKEPGEDDGKVEVIMGKQRNGPTGSFWLRFEGKTTRFSNLTDRQYSNNEEHRQH